MNKVYRAITYITILYYMAWFSTSTGMDGFNPKNCTKHEQCADVCFKAEDLESRCDLNNGVCVCDCHETEEITSSYPPACAGKQPDGHWRDFCDSFCTQEYRRPCRFCSDSSTGSSYCTCVCNKNTARFRSN